MIISLNQHDQVTKSEGNLDFRHTLSRGHIGYGKLSLISLRLCHLVMLVMVNYH
jgi:hypothetical protein